MDVDNTASMEADAKDEHNSVVYEPKITAGSSSQEIGQLKDMLLLHLDLMQQQQETILMKDRQLQSLHQEKSALQCRLDRMERRMALLRQQSQNTSRSSRKPPVVDSETEDPPSPIPRSSCRSSRTDSTSSRSAKRKRTFVRTKLAKRFKSERPCTDSENENRSPAKRSERHKLALQRHQLREQNEKLAQLKQMNKRQFPLSHDLSDAEYTSKFSCTPRPRSINIGGRYHDSSISRTGHLYHMVSRGDTEAPLGDLSPVRDVKHQSEVEVPSWRVVLIPRGYQMEGTENLDDEIYLRRHQKPENEERRRKRWDMQRLREERMKEKLQGRQEEESNDVDSMQFSFLPSPEKALYIEVQDTVPVVAFGYPVPQMKPAEFDLNWFKAEKKDREDKGRRKRAI
ncbi:hypothetical protein CAPTEDRAFT_225937 [Capitella teleta]|uniref:PEHE domain-containing protein n=1 Tax=Capitella teleta TaxID=283909 RepID=R7TBU0_CAPTE|nr:hypothetical protein CAPTEDRAFT_225937 [Capitella teleta]|eukprot:ELT91179.1 hypothetical protein CAPTEDRAFT_225937 [Capitella teleta]